MILTRSRGISKPRDREDDGERRRRIELDRIRKHFTASVAARWRASGHVCEGCGEVVDRVEAAHLAGKGGTGAGLPERWASHPDLGAPLCVDDPRTGRLGCHQDVDRARRDGVEKLRRLRWQAFCRLADTVDALFGAGVAFAEAEDPLDCIRRLVDAAVCCEADAS